MNAMYECKLKGKDLANGHEEEGKHHLHGSSSPQDPGMGMAMRTDGKSWQKGPQRNLPGTHESVAHSIFNTFKQLRMSFKTYNTQKAGI